MATSESTSRPHQSGAGPSTRGGSRSRGDWGARNGEPGSAFRGLSKGRGGPGGDRGGRGGGRGRGSSRGSGAPRNGRSIVEPKIDGVPPTKASTAPAEKPHEQASHPPPAAEKAPAAPSSTEKPSGRPKGPSRRPSRTVPSLVIAPSSPTTDVVQNGPTTPARPPNRRRRSQQQASNGKAAPASARQSLSVDPSPTAPRPRKAATGPPSPVLSSKDAPPHLKAASAAPNTTTFDMKDNIDALVERVRAAANRPSTPGSAHIDWAGDDDESLPDLDDWGVTTSTATTFAKHDMISPILEDSLKPLPEPNPSEKGSSPSPAEQPLESLPSVDAVSAAPVSKQGEPKTRQNERQPRAERGEGHRGTRQPRSTPMDGPAMADALLTARALANDVSPSPRGRRAQSPLKNVLAGSDAPAPVKSSPEAPKPVLHPSLPPKPVVAVDLPKPRRGATPMRVPEPSAAASTPSRPSSGSPPKGDGVSSQEGTLAAVEKASEAQVTQVHTDAKSELESTSIDHASAPLSTSPPVVDRPSKDDAAPPPGEPTDAHSHPNADGKQGLAASLHAPKDYVPKSSSAPSHPAAYALPAPGAPRTFNPAHSRSHTVGRPPHLNQPFSAPGQHARFPRSGPRGPFAPQLQGAAYHSRTHSSPPTPSSSERVRPAHSTRPVITGDAISRLARTIGASTPSRGAAVASKNA